MSWYKLSKQYDFDYDQELNSFWKELVRKEMDRTGIRFDLENDEMIETRTIDIGIQKNKKDNVKYRLLAEMREAGGDWECPNIYFRCQFFEKFDFYNHLRNKQTRGRWRASEKFIIIPEINLNLSNDKDDKSAIHNNTVDCRGIDDIGKKRLWKLLENEVKKRKKSEFNANEKESKSNKLMIKDAQKFEEPDFAFNRLTGDFENFQQYDSYWEFGDYKRWVIDSYRLSCRYTSTPEHIVLTANAWNWHNGIMVAEEFVKYKPTEEAEARKGFKKLQKICSEIHEDYTSGEYEQAPNSGFHMALKKRVWNEFRSRLAMTNIPHINYAFQKADYEADWRSSIYGNRYPTGQTSGF